MPAPGYYGVGMGKRKAMVKVGFHVSHEQLRPCRPAWRVSKPAEAAGFSAAMSSDHFPPSSQRVAESGFPWSWLGAAMQATALPFGVVTAPGQRHHPAILSPEVYGLLVFDRGWSGERYEKWLTAILIDQLLSQTET